jgi:hypothetical protein
LPGAVLPATGAPYIESLDTTRLDGGFVTLFRYDVHDPVVVDRATCTFATLGDPTTNAGIEAVTTLRRAPFSVTGT